MGTVANDMHLRKLEIERDIWKAAKKYSLELASLCIGEMNNVPLKSEPRRKSGSTTAST